MQIKAHYQPLRNIAGEFVGGTNIEGTKNRFQACRLLRQ